MRTVSVLARAIVIAGIGACFVPSVAGAREYPDKPVRVIVAFAAGGYADSVARLIGQKLGERLGHHFVIDNRGGVGGNIAARTAAEDVHPGSAADFARHVRAEVAVWAKIVKTTGVKAE